MNTLLLRFRNINIEDTIEEHNNVVANNGGKCLWGWWKKQQEPYPNNAISQIQKELQEAVSNYGNGRVFLVDSGTKKIYMASLYQIHYDDSNNGTLPPTPELCPQYYRNTKHPAWFEIGQITDAKPKDLEQYVISSMTPIRTLSESGTSVSIERVGQPLDTTDFTFLKDDISLWILEKETGDNTHYITGFKSYDSKTYPTHGRYIIHLSDLHFGEKHDFAIPESGKNVVGKDSLVNALLADLSKQKIAFSDIALVLITGELTCKASPHEFHEAERFINELQDKLGLSPVQIVCVPGNHDVEWVDESANLNYEAELNYKNFSKNIYNVEPSQFLGRFSEFLINGKKIAVIAFNSCRLESHENAGMGYISSEQFREASRLLSMEEEPFHYIIALLHHHVLPVNFTEYYSSKSKAVSLLLDSEALQQFLVENNVDVVMHGHQHQPYYSQLRRVIPAGIAGGEKEIDNSVTVIGGGSAGVSIGSLNAIGRNTYHLMKIENNKENPSLLDLNVTLRTRNGNGSGFVTAFTKSFTRMKSSPNE